MKHVDLQMEVIRGFKYSWRLKDLGIDVLFIGERDSEMI